MFTSPCPPTWISAELLAACLAYLDELRETGSTNMFGAAYDLADDLQLSVGEAKQVLVYWMATFSERHPRR